MIMTLESQCRPPACVVVDFALAAFAVEKDVVVAGRAVVAAVGHTSCMLQSAGILGVLSDSAACLVLPPACTFASLRPAAESTLGPLFS